MTAWLAAAVANATAAAAQLDLKLVARPVDTKEDLATRPQGDPPRRRGAGAGPRRARHLRRAARPLACRRASRRSFRRRSTSVTAGLASYGSDYYAEGFQAARLVARILRGARPQELPVEGADKLDLAVNLKTAAALGLTVPRKILLRADTLRR